MNSCEDVEPCFKLFVGTVGVREQIVRLLFWVDDELEDLLEIASLLLSYVQIKAVLLSWLLK